MSPAAYRPAISTQDKYTNTKGDNYCFNDKVTPIIFVNV
jgi:hypothetical protein